MFASATVNAGNVTDADVFGPTVTGRLATSRPSISSLTWTLVKVSAPRFVSPTVGVTRSSPENDDRGSATDDTDRSDVSNSATVTGVSVAPSGRWISSRRSQPLFWKSLMRYTSLRGSCDWLSSVCARRKAGP